jgi:hypothetical protein
MLINGQCSMSMFGQPTRRPSQHHYHRSYMSRILRHRVTSLGPGSTVRDTRAPQRKQQCSVRVCVGRTGGPATPGGPPSRDKQRTEIPRRHCPMHIPAGGASHPGMPPPGDPFSGVPLWNPTAQLVGRDRALWRLRPIAFSGSPNPPRHSASCW